jgi:hypothetical protein
MPVWRWVFLGDQRAKQTQFRPGHDRGTRLAGKELWPIIQLRNLGETKKQSQFRGRRGSRCRRQDRLYEQSQFAAAPVDGRRLPGLSRGHIAPYKPNLPQAGRAGYPREGSQVRVSLVSSSDKREGRSK